MYVRPPRSHLTTPLLPNPPLFRSLRGNPVPQSPVKPAKRQRPRAVWSEVATEAPMRSSSSAGQRQVLPRQVLPRQVLPRPVLPRPPHSTPRPPHPTPLRLFMIFPPQNVWLLKRAETSREGE